MGCIWFIPQKSVIWNLFHLNILVFDMICIPSGTEAGIDTLKSYLNDYIQMGVLTEIINDI